MTTEQERMPASALTPQALLDNLEDAGCGPEVAERFLTLEKTGQHQEQLKLLSEHRRHLLNCLHREERRIDCLDFLVYQLERRSAGEL